MASRPDLTRFETTYVQPTTQKKRPVACLKRDNENIEDKKRWASLVAMLEAKHLEHNTDPWNILSSSVVESVARELAISSRQVKRIWEEYVTQRESCNELSMVSNRHSKSLRTPSEPIEHSNHHHHFRSRWDFWGKKFDIEELVELIASVNNQCKQQLSLRDLSAELLAQKDIYVPKTTLAEIFKYFKFEKEISHAKPVLTLKHMRKRVTYVLGQVDKSTEYNVGDRLCFKFADHKNRVSSILCSLFCAALLLRASCSLHSHSLSLLLCSAWLFCFALLIGSAWHYALLCAALFCSLLCSVIDLFL